MRCALTLLALVLAAACTPAPLDGPTPFPETVQENPLATAPAAPIRVCVDVAPAQRAKVLQGVDGWAEVTSSWRGWEVQPAGATDCDLQVIEAGEGEACADDASACVQTIGGLDRARPFGIVYMVVGRYEVNPTYATIHEVGHLLGLEHADDSIMQAKPTASMWGAWWDCPDNETIKRLEAHLGTSLGRCIQ